MPHPNMGIHPITQDHDFVSVNLSMVLITLPLLLSCVRRHKIEKVKEKANEPLTNPKILPKVTEIHAQLL